MNGPRPNITEDETELATVSADSEEFTLTVPSLTDVGWLLVGSGLFGSIVSLLRERRGFLDLAVPLCLIGLGSGVLLKQRQTHMEAAEENIRAELSALDPVARAQVLKEVAKEELGLGSPD